MFTKAVIHLRILRHGTLIKLGINKYTLIRIVRLIMYANPPDSEPWLFNELIAGTVRLKKDELYLLCNTFNVRVLIN